MKHELHYKALGIRLTPLRGDLITFFLENPGVAYSENEINEIVDGEFDRTTVYRNLRMLLKKVFIHKIICENGVLKFALTPKNKPYRNHPHFQCTICGKVSCLQDYEVQNIKLPDEYQTCGLHLLIRGIGPCCNSKK